MVQSNIYKYILFHFDPKSTVQFGALESLLIILQFVNPIQASGKVKYILG